MKTKKILASIAASALLLTGIAGITAQAAAGRITTRAGYTTLVNQTGQTRYGNVSLNVIRRSNGAVVKRVGAERVLSPYASVTASANGYSSTTYRFYGYGTLYRGTSVNSGSYWSGSQSY